MDAKTRVVIRRRVQWVLLWVVVVTIGLGWKYPWLGFSVPIVMAAGMVGGVLRGRYVCGNFCPRGSFFDRVLAPLSRRAPIPGAFRNRTLRWALLAAMMGFMLFRVLQNPADWRHWGRVFWLMCLVTTAIGVALGLAVHPRAWCAFCPMGTVQSAIGGRRKPLVIDAERCITCRRCEKVCPFNLAIMPHKEAGRLGDPDCLRCGECVAACPKQALSWPRG